MNQVTIIGAGLAGCEAAWQLASRGISVRLYEMKPVKKTPAHQSEDFAELVCSNSLRSNDTNNAVGLLKEELRQLNSLIMQAADATALPAGSALAVDREGFSAYVTKQIRSHPLIEVIQQEVCAIPTQGETIVASGPLTSDDLAQEIQRFFGGTEGLHFFDAAAPIVTRESIDMQRAFYAARYDAEAQDYINCPMDEAEYRAFWEALTTAREAQLHGFEDSSVFEGCMPVEVMGRRGFDTLRYGPMKPVGLPDPRTGREAFAVVQLRRDNAAGELYNLVGFQTHLAFPEQRRVFGMIPALSQAEFVRYGVMHRNTYLDAPRQLDRYYRALHAPSVMFAGQMTGVEGYVESTASGALCAIELAQRLKGKPALDFPKETAMGALAAYISDTSVINFQPMNINFGLMPGFERAEIKEAAKDVPRNPKKSKAAMLKQVKNQMISARAQRLVAQCVRKEQEG